MAKKPKADPYGTNGGNGGYARKKPVTDKPGPKRGKKPYDYQGKDARRPQK